MRDVLYPPHVPTEPDPVKRSQNAMVRHALPKRFYRNVAVVTENGRFAIKLDGRGAKTPGRNALDLPTQAAAELVAAEWSNQKEVIDPHAMALTRIVNTAIDHVADRLEDVAADIAGYAANDLVCYRADEPEGLVNKQCQHWDPVLAWSANTLQAPLQKAKGIMHVEQDKVALQRIADGVFAVKEPIALSCLHVMTTLSGSCLIALMTAAGALSVQEAWMAASVDEDWTAALWGQDEEAMYRANRRKQEFEAATALCAAVTV
jgi:chaperone required for assembly of F1-ATPase